MNILFKTIEGKDKIAEINCSEQIIFSHCLCADFLEVCLVSNYGKKYKMYGMYNKKQVKKIRKKLNKSLKCGVSLFIWASEAHPLQ